MRHYTKRKYLIEVLEYTSAKRTMIDYITIEKVNANKIIGNNLIFVTHQACYLELTLNIAGDIFPKVLGT